MTLFHLKLVVQVAAVAIRSWGRLEQQIKVLREETQEIRGVLVEVVVVQAPLVQTE
jgi:hypothetical protein